MYESSLHERLVKRTPTQLTPTSYERYRADEAKLVQNRLLLEGPLLDESPKIVTLQSLHQKVTVDKRSFRVKVCPLLYDILPKKPTLKTWNFLWGNVYCMADRWKQYGYFVRLSTDYLLFAVQQQTSDIIWLMQNFVLPFNNQTALSVTLRTINYCAV